MPGRLGFLVILCATVRAEFLRLEFTLTGVDCAACFESLPTRLGWVRGVESVNVDRERGKVSLRLAPNNRVRLVLIRDMLQQDGTKVREVRLETAGSVGQTNDRWMFVPSGVGEQYLVTAAHEPQGSVVVKGTIREFPAPPADWVIDAETVRARQ